MDIERKWYKGDGTPAIEESVEELAKAFGKLDLVSVHSATIIKDGLDNVAAAIRSLADAVGERVDSREEV